MKHVKIFKGWPLQYAPSELVQLWYWFVHLLIFLISYIYNIFLKRCEALSRDTDTVTHHKPTHCGVRFRQCLFHSMSSLMILLKTRIYKAIRQLCSLCAAELVLLVQNGLIKMERVSHNVQCVAVCGSVLQWAVVCCSRLECAADIVVLVPGGLKGAMFDQDAKVLSQRILHVLQCVAVCCSVGSYCKGSHTMYTEPYPTCSWNQFHL